MNASRLNRIVLLALVPTLMSAQPARTVSQTLDSQPIAGVQELTFAGSGGSNRQFSDSFGGASVSYGMYFNNEWQGVVRQTINYHNPDGAGTTWSGSTRLAADYHLTELGMAMPFFGASFGRIYGSSVRDTWSGGLEAGLKYFMRRKVFVFAMAEYNWFFQRARRADNNFGDGQFQYTTGLGFNF